MKDDAAWGTNGWRTLATHGLNELTVGRIARVTIEDLRGCVRVYVLVQSKLDTEDTRSGDANAANELLGRIAGRMTRS